MSATEDRIEDLLPAPRRGEEAARFLEERLSDWRCVLPTRAAAEHEAAQQKVARYRRAVREGREDAAQALAQLLIPTAATYGG